MKLSDLIPTDYRFYRISGVFYFVVSVWLLFEDNKAWLVFFVLAILYWFLLGKRKQHDKYNQNDKYNRYDPRDPE